MRDIEISEEFYQLLTFTGDVDLDKNQRFGNNFITLNAR